MARHRRGRAGAGRGAHRAGRLGRRPAGPGDARWHVRAHRRRDRRQGQQRQRRPRRRRAASRRGASRCACSTPPTARRGCRAADLVIDAAYGTGFHGEWSAPRVGAAPVLAVDIPSGVDGLTGEAGRGVLAADRTVTFAALKPGLCCSAPGATWPATSRSSTSGSTPAGPGPSSSRPRTSPRWWRPRPPTAHKWTRAVRVVAGSPGHDRRRPPRVGGGPAGRERLWCRCRRPASRRRRRPRSCASGCRRSTGRPPVLDDLHRFHALVIGPGLGRETFTVQAVRATVAAAAVPVVVDGDGLFAMAWDADGAAPRAAPAPRRRPC